MFHTIRPHTTHSTQMMTMTASFLLTLAFLASRADAFTTHGSIVSCLRTYLSNEQSPQRSSQRHVAITRRDVRTPSSLNLLTTDPSGRHYQLEELEDAEASTTDIFLNADNTVIIGESDGPLCTSSSGKWSDFAPSDSGAATFEMVLTRTFITGSEKGKSVNSANTAIGEFEYTVVRTYRGEVSMVGGSVLTMNGEIVDVDEVFGDRRVRSFCIVCRCFVVSDFVGI